jgi:putative PEP-CTERM system histidine kinase
MIIVPVVLSFVASALLATLGIILFARPLRQLQRTLFAATVSLLAVVEALIGAAFVTSTPDATATVLRILIVCSLLFLPLATAFFMVFGKPNGREILNRRIPWIALATILVGVVAFAVPADRIIREVLFLGDSFWGVNLAGFGRFLCVCMTLSLAYWFYVFENTWRSATIPEKTALKYPLVGMVTSGIITLVVLGRTLAISSLDGNYIAVHSTGVIALALCFMFATMRYRLFDVKVYVGRGVASSFVSISIAGAYLLALAMIAYLARTLGLPYDRLTLWVLAVFAVFSIVVVLVSGKAKRRIRRYLDENFYLNRYDYRKEWSHMVQLMATSSTIDQFLPDFISRLCESMMVESGVAWIDAGAGKAASYGPVDNGLSDRDAKTFRALLGPGSIHVADRGKDARIDEAIARSDQLQWVKAAAALGSGGQAIGLILLGPKALDLSYSEEDVGFLTTLSHQATATIENFLLERKIIDASQMDTFNRFASFVIHDLKNTMGMLSLTAENAEDNISDTEFQRDAMETIRRSVQKMQHLIRSLGAIESNPPLKREVTDLTALIEHQTHTLETIAKRRGISILFDGPPAIEAEVDPQAIERIVENLVHNAIDASPVGGVVRVGLANDDGAIRIDVADQGKGFDPDYLSDHAFRPFHSTKKEGLGIGLVMCKTLAEAHGGGMSIESRGREGARVTVRVPARVGPKG